MIALSYLTEKDLEALKKKAKFSEEQIVILHHLVLGDKNDEGMMMELRLSRNKYYRIKRDLLNKIIRIAVQS